MVMTSLGWLVPAFLVAALFVSTQSTAATITHYDVDFGAPHTIGLTPMVGIGSEGPSTIQFGAPTVESSLLSLDTPMLLFNTFGTPGTDEPRGGEQIRFELGLGYDNYDISFDFVSHGITTNDYSFATFLDGSGSNSRRMDFRGDRDVPIDPSVTRFNSSVPPLDRTGRISSFENGLLYHVVMNVDLVHNLWTMSVNGVTDQTAFSQNEGGLDSVRFSLSSTIGGAGVGNGISAGLDNVLITSTVVPEPSTGLLLSLGVVGLGINRRRSAARMNTRQ